MSAKNKSNDWYALRSNYNQRCLYYNTRRELKPAYPSMQNKYATKDEMAIPIDVLRNLDRLSKGWYIVADINVLFYDISFLRSYIVGDPTCQLLTPIAILNKIDAMCSTDPTGVARAARQSLAQLEACSRHVRFDGDVEVNWSSDRCDDDTDEILKCCQKTMSHGFHVVLITRSRGLQTLAEIRGVHVYDVQEIKRGIKKDKIDGRNIVPLHSNRHAQSRYHGSYNCIRYTPGHSSYNDRYGANERRRRNCSRHISYSRN